MAGINFKAFDLGGHEIARKVWKDYYAKVNDWLSYTGRCGHDDTYCASLLVPITHHVLPRWTPSSSLWMLLIGNALQNQKRSWMACFLMTAFPPCRFWCWATRLTCSMQHLRMS